jgi:hypothetical protein
MAEMGMPLPSPLAMTMTSGTMPAWSKPKNLPVRPNPLCTSSTISKMPCSVHSWRSSCMKAGGAGT